MTLWDGGDAMAGRYWVSVRTFRTGTGTAADPNCQLKRGKGVDELIDKVDKAARAYPWKTTYKAFPGPNSNTFTAWVGLLVPELEMELPFSAIGSGYTKKN
jgi:hypothetical protein